MRIKAILGGNIWPEDEAIIDRRYGGHHIPQPLGSFDKGDAFETTLERNGYYLIQYNGKPGIVWKYHFQVNQ